VGIEHELTIPLLFFIPHFFSINLSLSSLAHSPWIRWPSFDKKKKKWTVISRLWTGLFRAHAELSAWCQTVSDSWLCVSPFSMQ
jgi:hypothetical protein